MKYEQIGETYSRNALYGFNSQLQAEEEVLVNYPLDKKIKVFYNPKKPQESMLFRVVYLTDIIYFLFSLFSFVLFSSMLIYSIAVRVHLFRVSASQNLLTQGFEKIM